MANPTDGNVIANQLPGNIVRNLFLNDEHADIYFKFKSGNEIVRVPAHKTFLISGSAVFKTMFTGTLKETGDVEIADVNVNAFKEFLQFFYLGTVEATMENIDWVMYLAEKYDVPDCMNFCERFMINQPMNDSDILSYYELAIKFQRCLLKEHLEKRISEEPLSVLSSDNFETLSKEILESVLKIKNLNWEPFAIFDACVQWSESACLRNNKEVSQENKRNELGNCFDLIPFALMDPVELAECATSHRGFFNSAELEDIIDMMTGNDSQLQLFKPKSYFIRWNESASIRCCRSGSVMPYSHNVNQLEVASFMVNTRMLFGGIEMDEIRTQNFDLLGTHLSGRLIVTEGANNSNGKLLMMTQKIRFVIGEQAVIPFTVPVLLRPNKFYDVAILFDDSWICKEYFVMAPSYLPQVTSDKNCQVNFLRNSDLHYNNGNRGIISSLYFNSFSDGILPNGTTIGTSI